MSKKYNFMKQSLIEDNKNEYTKLTCKILDDGLMDSKQFTHKFYMELLEDEIVDLKKENEKLKIRYIDFKNMKEENEKLKKF